MAIPKTLIFRVACALGGNRRYRRRAGLSPHGLQHGDGGVNRHYPKTIVCERHRNAARTGPNVENRCVVSQTIGYGSGQLIRHDGAMPTIVDF